MIRLFILSSVLSSLDAFRLAPPSSLLLHGGASRDSAMMATTSSPPLPRRTASSPLHAAAAAGEDDAAAEGGIPDETKASSEGSGDVSDILNSPAFLKRKVEVLQSDIAALEKELEEATAVASAAKEEWGAKFDMLNKESKGMQDRLAKQGALGTETATIDVATRILNVLDNYDRAFQSVEAATNEEVEIVDAYKKTYDMILDAFVELNVTKVETVGYEFNYEMHQAMMQMPSDEYEEGIVCQEFAMGWKFGEKLIRPAMVVVTA
ncbi:hypothetical protein ACHAW5_006288 [Stephanodiscus triporus]|uniref:GrpE protein homolog n=1 Tax=Stephanodiscus triporus TaxID=2934178 RepID=A0ABD3QE04_9STRA